MITVAKISPKSSIWKYVYKLFINTTKHWTEIKNSKVFEQKGDLLNKLSKADLSLVELSQAELSF